MREYYKGIISASDPLGPDLGLTSPAYPHVVPTLHHVLLILRPPPQPTWLVVEVGVPVEAFTKIYTFQYIGNRLHESPRAKLFQQPRLLLPWVILMSILIHTSHFSRPSLESMGPTTRSHGRPEVPLGKEIPRRHVTREDSSSDGKASDALLEEEDDDEDTRNVVRSPATRISYDISGLDLDTQSEVRQLFRETPGSEPPPLVLQWCQLNQEVYAFQLHEVIPRSIRIGSSSSKYSSPRCNCMADNDKPCKHLIFLMDQLNYLGSDTLLDEPVQKLGRYGSFPDATQCFSKLSNFHLDLLASNLHCDVGSPETNLEVNRTRLEEAREILATVAESDADDYAVQHYRPDIFENQDSILEKHGIVSASDLTKTVAKMLIHNNDFFAYFLKLLGPNSKARDPFGKIQQHVDRVLSELEAYSRHPSVAEKRPEGPRNVPWAAVHVVRAVSAIQHHLQNREDAPSPAERASAARTLVRILHTVVFDWNRDVSSSTTTTTTTTASATTTTTTAATSGVGISTDASTTPSSPGHNLYEYLICSRTTSPKSFVLDTLSQLPEQNQWIEALEEIEAKLSTYGPPAGYMRRVRDLITLMRNSRPAATSGGQARTAAGAEPSRSVSGAGSKRRGGGGGGGGGSGGSGGSGREGGAKRAR